MGIGGLLAGAGVVGQSWRQEENAQRLAREQQLRIAELNRLERLRQEMASAPPVEVPNFLFNANAGTLPVIGATSTAATTNTTSATPVIPATPAAATTHTAQAVENKQTTPTETQPSSANPLLDQLYGLPQVKVPLSQSEQDRLALLSLPTAAGDVIQAPAAAALNLGTAVGEAVINVGGRLINAITGKEIASTNVQGPRWSLTPFYDKYVRKPWYAAVEKAQAEQRANLPFTQFDPQKLYEAMIKVESGGNPNAVSNKGAVGLMQVLPSTAMQPGFGLPNIFDFAEQMGVKVGQRNESEAKRLLTNPKVGAAYGQLYMDALLKRYNNNLPVALAAYHAGPATIDRWLFEGADPNKLPKATLDYISKIESILYPKAAAKNESTPTSVAGLTLPSDNTNTTQTQAPVVGLNTLGALTATQTPISTSAATAGANPLTALTALASGGSSATSAQSQQTEPLTPSQFYLANPQAIPFDMQQMLHQRTELAQLAGMYQRAGLGAQYMMARAKLMELDNNLMQLQGMQGLRELTLANDPRRLAAVLSQYAGVPVNIQPRTDGKWDVLVNGQRTQTGVTADKISDLARSMFDQAYLQQKAAASAEYNKKAYESMLKMQEKAYEAQYGTQQEIVKQIAQMIRELATTKLKGDIELATQITVEQMKQRGWKITPIGDGSGTVAIVPPPDSGINPFVVDMKQLLNNQAAKGSPVPLSPSVSIPIPAQMR